MYSRLCHEHVLFEGPTLVNERVKRWARVKQSMTATLISSIECMNTSIKVSFYSEWIEL